MKIIDINDRNLDSEHICCAIGNDAVNKARAQKKKEWLKGQFAAGLAFRRLDARGKVFIEYMPIESVWKPLIGSNYLVINCLWVSGQFKGQGHAAALLNECIEDARKQKKSGIAVVTSDRVKPFLTDKRFFLEHGFQVVDAAPPYFELAALNLADDGNYPRFTPGAKTGECGVNNGFAFIYSNQCVFMEEYVGLLHRAALDMNIPSKAIKLRSCAEAQENGSPFGTLGIYYNGKFLTHELMTEAKFRALAGKTIS